MKDGIVVVARPGNWRTADASLICFTTTLGAVGAACRITGLIEVLRYLGVVSPLHFGLLKVL